MMKNSTKTLGCVFGGPSHFKSLFDTSIAISSPDEVAKCAGVLLHGGTDIASSLYNEQPHPTNQNRSGKPSERDLFEWECVKVAVENDVPIFGICRGLQLLCAYDGGKLIQDLPHAFHGEAVMAVIDYDLTAFTCPVSHHQAVVLNPRNGAEVLGWEQKTHLPYAVRFPKLSAFGVQGHPEWADKNSPFVQYCLTKFEEMLK